MPLDLDTENFADAQQDQSTIAGGAPQQSTTPGGAPRVDEIRQVKLPPFWHLNPALWFAQVEAQFHAYHVPSDQIAFLAKEVNIKMKGSRTTTKINKKDIKMQMEEKDMDCNCLPSCTSLEFDIETSQSDWDWWAAITTLKVTEVMEGLHLSRLKIFFKDMQFITSERNQLYGTTDFWANCGGLLGLFTGFSFISIVEIVYFVTLRFICNLKKFGRHYWSGAEELIAKKDTLQNNGTESNDLTIDP